MLGINFNLGRASADVSLGKYEERALVAYDKLCCEARRAEEHAEQPGFGWLALPESDISEIKSFGEKIGTYDNVVHIGIGGSALGTLMLNEALLPFFYNEGNNRPKFYVADNPDPDKMQAICESIARHNGRNAVVAVSKSGGTAETVSQLLWFTEHIADCDVYLITDKTSGIFREFASTEHISALELPSTVGGRYSVLSSAALASACALGIDVDALIAGASEMKKYIFSERDFYKNGALTLAAIYVGHMEAGRNMAVMMPYSERLGRFCEWIAQLWGESIGKNGKGSTPIRALGAVDQHSQVQLYTEGPDDKFYTIMCVEERSNKCVIPDNGNQVFAPVAYMFGKETGDMLNLEAMGTASALVQEGRPVALIEIERIDARTLGALVFFYEYITAAAGLMMGIDPFDQPGVEAGKRNTKALMGSRGLEQLAAATAETIEEIKKIHVNI